MASIRTQIELMDRITSPLMNITSALNMTVSAFESMDAAANSSFDSSNFDGVREHLNAANMELDEMVQNINEADQQQQEMNNSLNQGTRSASGLERKLLGVAATYASLQGVQKLLNLSDTATLTESRLSLIVDDGGSVEELQNKIFASAQNSRAAYSDVSATIAKLGMMAGDAFTNNDELIAFTELMNKNFVVGGASAAEQASAMYQLTQAMGSGKLQGDEYRSIIENAPMLAKSIEDYMTNVQGATGSMKDWASEGMLTADVIKAAMFNASDQVNEQFENMPKTFGQVATSLKNQALFAFDPLLEKLNDIANSESFNTIATGLTNAFVFASGVAVGALDLITQAGAFLADNWSIIAPLIYGVAAALGIYTGYMIISNAVQLISTGIQTAHAIAIAVKTGATIADAAATNNLTVAQWALNSAMLASPITWIIIGIIAIIAIIYMAVAAFNKFAGTSVSATGIIMGAFAVLGAFIWNTVVGVINAVIQFLWTRFAEPWIGIIEWVLNAFNGGFNSFGDAVANLLGQIISWFLSLGKVVTKIIDAIFGTSWTAGLSSLQDSVLAWGKNDNAITLDRNAPTIDSRIEYSGAWDAGYSMGEGIDEAVSNFDPSNLFNMDIPDPSDYASGYDAASVPGNIADTASNTGAMKDAVDISSDDLKYMRDLAEMETVNRFTTAEIKVDMSGMQNIVNNEMDLDGVVEYMVEKVNEAADAIATEGVHN
ncbi:phage tape measure protein [Clostridium sartagoforme AAU1]|uniref:Phage tape measure protein n=1 Tax=Clostridium sartagoforme AAU1 TaxID=1202534 RepID=R9C7M1_9CLOT|nr:tape measure protein [Clostridium sartagoforme]EOR25307.1 phage tape measure protein [Clostridium sartagoforme AAU1]